MGRIVQDRTSPQIHRQWPGPGIGQVKHRHRQSSTSTVPHIVLSFQFRRGLGLRLGLDSSVPVWCGTWAKAKARQICT